MSVAEARTWGDKIKTLGDSIVGLTVLEAKDLEIGRASCRERVYVLV